MTQSFASRNSSGRNTNCQIRMDFYNDFVKEEEEEEAAEVAADFWTSP